MASVASLFVSRWDVAVRGKVPGELSNQLGIAVARRTYTAYRELMDSARFQRAANAGARAQHLLWASTGTKDQGAPDTLCARGALHGQHDAGGARCWPSSTTARFS